jgi:hypothetical protein
MRTRRHGDHSWRHLDLGRYKVVVQAASGAKSVEEGDQRGLVTAHLDPHAASQRLASR